MKEKKIAVGAMVCLVVLALVATIVVLVVKQSNATTTTPETPTAGNENSINQDETKSETSNTIPNEIDKYWNIDTSKFNASLFDGKFSICGNVIQSKLTGKTLKDNGYELKIGSGLFKELLLDSENNVYSDKSNGVYILKNNKELLEGVHLENYNKETSIYSDNTELVVGWRDNSVKYNEIIFPTCLIYNPTDIVYNTLTVENIVKELGAPTYVQGRLTKTIKDGQFFKYVYVYSDYTLWFDMLYYKKSGITVTGFSYEGNNSFNQPCKYYDADTNEFREYSKTLDYLNEEQTKYENSI